MHQRKLVSFFFEDIPLLGGQRIKALEFFSHGLLVVSGQEGVKGLSGLEANKHFFMAKTFDSMIDVLKECIKHPEKYTAIA